MRQTGSTHATQTTNEPPIEPPILNTKRKALEKFDAVTYLKSNGVDLRIAADWIDLRKTKKAAVTLTAINGIEREAMKAGVSLQSALETCCERGWAGFNAGWLENKPFAGAFMTAQQRRDENNRRSSEEFVNGGELSEAINGECHHA